MKSVLKLLILFLLPALSFAQKDVSICDTLKADLDSGIVNKLKPDAPFDSLKSIFPVTQRKFLKMVIPNAGVDCSTTG